MISIHTHAKAVPLVADPILLLRELQQQHPSKPFVLLESADMSTHQSTKSILMIQSALQISSRNSEVTVKSITPFGQAFLKQLQENLKSHVVDQSENTARFRFDKLSSDLSLKDRLKAPSSLDVLRRVMHVAKVDPLFQDRFLLMGLFAYDFIDQIEDLPAAKQDELGFPDFIFFVPEVLLVTHHASQQTELIQHGLDGDGEIPPPPFIKGDFFASPFEKGGQGDFPVNHSPDISDTEFKQLVETVKKRIVLGDVFQIVPSRTFKAPCTNPLLAYEILRSLNPSPYMYFVYDADFEILGASPETFIKVDSYRQVTIKPIAGTRRRGFDGQGQIDPELDIRLEAELKLNTKEVAEHMMLVDLARNDIARICKTKSRTVPRLMQVDRYSHVMHLVSEVSGELKDDLDALHAYQASMNMGTLVGAPKIKAAQILREVENTKRGPYGGAIGYLDARGVMDTAILIRTAIVKNQTAYVRAGAGVVFDSCPDDETLETHNKAEAVLKAITLSNIDGAKS